MPRANEVTASPNPAGQGVDVKGAYALDPECSWRANALRTVAVLLVVVSHAAEGRVNLASGAVVAETTPFFEAFRYVIAKIVAFSTPTIFYAISAVLLYRKEFRWADNMKKKLRTIGVPYLFWNAFWLLAFFLLQTLPVSQPYFSNPDNLIRNFKPADFLNAFYGFTGGADNVYYPFYYPFWFMKDLFLLNVFSVAIKKACDRAPLLAYGAAFLAFVFNVNLFVIEPRSLFGFMLGYAIVTARLPISAADRVPWAHILLLYGAGIALELFVVRGDIAINRVNSLIGALFFAKLSRQFYIRPALNRLFSFLAPFPFAIFAFHEYGLTALKKALAMLLPQSVAMSWLLFFALPVAVVAYCVALALILRKLCPKALAVVTGGR